MWFQSTVQPLHEWKGEKLIPETIPLPCPFNTQTQLTIFNAHKHTQGWITDNRGCLSPCSTCAWKQLIFYPGVRNHPAATSSEKWSNLKALLSECDIHDLDSSGSRAKPPCHKRSGRDSHSDWGRRSKEQRFAGEGEADSALEYWQQECEIQREKICLFELIASIIRHSIFPLNLYHCPWETNTQRGSGSTFLSASRDCSPK